MKPKSEMRIEKDLIYKLYPVRIDIKITNKLFLTPTNWLQIGKISLN